MRIDEDVLPEFRQLSRSFNQMLERLNNAFAARADAVVRVVCGIPVYYKGVEK